MKASALPLTLRTIIFLFSVFSLSINAQTLVPGTLTGNTNVEFDVTYGGAASYKVTLDLPTGAAGLTPNISLNYNSQFGNGVMGLGWQLASGLARIEECYRRNTNQRINCLNGEELRSIGGGYYRTEIDSGVLIRAVNSSTFELNYENGVTKTLTRQLTSPNVYLESSHVQRGGASYSVNWSVNTTNREPLVNTITYQGNTIQFNYETRSDRRNGYWLGGVRNRTQRLRSIVASADGQVYRQYNIFYQYDSVSSVSKITNIQECAGNGECLRPLAFSWTDSGARGFESGNTQYSGRIRGLAEFNNDGRIDIVTEGPLPDSTSHYDTQGDMNGDGRDETINVRYTYNETVTFNVINSALGINRSFVEHQLQTRVNVLDLNGNGKDEVVVRGDSHMFYLTDTGTVGNLGRIPGFICTTDIYFADINGDNLPDMINAAQGFESGNGCNGRSSVAINLGNYQFADAVEIGGGSLLGQVFADINGDGITDILYAPGRVYYLPALGNGRFAAPVEISTRRANNIQHQFRDLNGDGLNDLILINNNSTPTAYSVQYNNGSAGFGSEIPIASPGNSGRYFEDYNGDGVVDIIDFAAPSNHRVTLGASSQSYIDTFTDSYGNQHQVEYSKLTDSEVYTRDSYTDGVNFGDTKPYQKALTVVKSLTTPDQQVYYKYAGARMHNGEYGYLGFKSITSVLAKEDNNGLPHSLVTVSYLNQQFPLVGKLQAVKKKVYEGLASSLVDGDTEDDITYSYGDDGYLVAMLNGSAVGAATASDLVDDVQGRMEIARLIGTDFPGQMNSYFDWQTLTLTGGVHKLYLADKVVDHLQLSDDALTKTEREQSSWSLASSGRYARLNSTTSGTYTAGGDLLQEQQVDITYENTDSYGASSSFLMNQSTTTTTLRNGTSVVDTHVVDKEYDYYNNELVQYEWLNRSDIKGTRTYYQYDAYGNPTITTLEAVNSSSSRSEAPRTMVKAYINQGKYLSSDTNSLGHVASYSNYSVHGLPQRVTDPTGLVSIHSYDPIGRIQQTTDHLTNNHYTYRGFCSAGGSGCTNNAYSWERSVPAGGAESYSYWDQKGNKVKMATQTLQPGQWVVEAWEYDQYSRETKASVPAIQALSAAVSFTAGSDYHFTQNTYDELNRITHRQLPGVNREVRKNYVNELALTTIDPLGRRTITVTNALGQVTSKEQPDNTDVRFTYNAQGLVIEQEYPRLDSAGNVSIGQYHQVLNSYDRYGNQTSLNDPNQGNWTYQYNAFGELIQQTDARNQSTYFTYDTLGRMRTQRDDETYSVWVYDSEENGLLDTAVQYSISHLSSGAKANLTPANVATTAGVTVMWQQDTDYNDINKQPERLQTRQRNRSAQLLTSTTTMEYDGFGRLQYTQLPALYQNQGSLTAPRLTYRYSDSGYLNRISDRDSGTIYQDITAVDGFGNITAQTLAGNVELFRGYNAHTGWASDLQATNSSGLVIDQSYGNYNALGHIGSRDDASYYNGGADVQSWTDTFAYTDALQQQLTQVTVQYTQDINGINLSEDWTHNYQYDALGNMRSNGLTLGATAPRQQDSHTSLAAAQLQSQLSALYNLNSSDELLQSALPAQLTLSGTTYNLNTGLFTNTRPGTSVHELNTSLIRTEPLNPPQPGGGASTEYQLQTDRLDTDTAPGTTTLSYRTLNGMSTTANSGLIKTAEDGWVNGNFDSNETLAANTNGWIEFIVTDATQDDMAFGFASDSATGYNMPYRFWLEGGNVVVYESLNVVATSSTPYSVGDVLKIERQEGVVSYWQNNTMFYQSAQTSTEELRLEGIVYAQNASISHVWASFGTSSGETPVGERFYRVRLNDDWARVGDVLYGSEDVAAQLQTALEGTYSLTEGETIVESQLPASITVTLANNEYGLDDDVLLNTENRPTNHLLLPEHLDDTTGAGVTYRSLNGMATNATGGVTKTVEDGWVNSGFDSNETLPANQDGWVEFTITASTASETTFGFAIDINAGYDMPYRFWLEGGAINLYEGLNWLDTIPTPAYSIGDTLRIERQGTTIHYLHNNTVIHSSTQADPVAMRVGGIIYFQNGTLDHITASFADGNSGGGVPTYTVLATDTPNGIAAKLYGSEGVIDELQAALGITTFAVGDQLTGLPASLTDDDAIVVVPDYYPVPPNSSWVTLARDLYGNEAVAEELEVAMGSPSTIPAQLTNLPATLVDVPVVEPVEPYYLLEVNQTWEEVAAALYDSAGVLDELHTALGLNNPPPLQIGDTLTNLPATLTDDDIINTVPPFYTLSSISSWEELARTLYGTSDEAVSPNTPPPNRPAGAMQYQYTDAARPHRLTSVTGPIGRNYSYDANGNTVSDGSKTFTYNAWNKVATLTQGGNSTRFEYGPDRKRYLRVDQQGSSPNQVTTETLYVGDGYERVTTIDGGTTVEHKYHVYGIALITQAEGGNTETTHSLISDYQDSLLAIADQSGNLIQRFRYTPFGEQVDVSQGITGSHSFTTKGYTSHEHIEGMDIIHMNGRIYDPVIGRMVQSDPIIQAPEQILSYNRYSYVWNNPMNRIDPTGYMGDSIGPDGDGPESVGNTSGELGEADSNTEGTSHVDGTPNPSQQVSQDTNAQNVDSIDELMDEVKSNLAKASGLPKGLFDLGDFVTPIRDAAVELKNGKPIEAVIAALGFVAKKAEAAASVLKKGKDETVELFRVVDEVELDDIKKTKEFRTVPGQFEGKQFVDNMDDAKELQKEFTRFFGGKQTIVKGSTAKSVVDNSSRIDFSDIPNGQAITISKDNLPLVKPQL